MTTSISKSGLDEIVSHEGIVLKAYPDPGSSNGLPWTIGVGHTKGVRRGDKITKAQAMVFLKADVAWAEAAVVKYIGTHLNQNQFDAMVSFTFNVGAGAMRKSSPAKYAKAKQHDKVPGRLNLWVKNDGRTLKGLVRRRASEGKLYMTPVVETEMEKVAMAKVDVEQDKGKPISKSKVGLTAMAQGGAGVAVAVTQAADIKEQASRLLDGLDFNATPVILGGMCLAGIASAIWFFLDRRNKAKEFGA